MTTNNGSNQQQAVHHDDDDAAFQPTQAQQQQLDAQIQRNMSNFSSFLHDEDDDGGGAQRVPVVPAAAAAARSGSGARLAAAQSNYKHNNEATVGASNTAASRQHDNPNKQPPLMTLFDKQIHRSMTDFSSLLHDENVQGCKEDEDDDEAAQRLPVPAAAAARSQSGSRSRLAAQSNYKPKKEATVGASNTASSRAAQRNHNKQNNAATVGASNTAASRQQQHTNKQPQLTTLFHTDQQTKTPVTTTAGRVPRPRSTGKICPSKSGNSLDKWRHNYYQSSQQEQYHTFLTTPIQQTPAEAHAQAQAEAVIFSQAQAEAFLHPQETKAEASSVATSSVASPALQNRIGTSSSALSNNSNKKTPVRSNLAPNTSSTLPPTAYQSPTMPSNTTRYTTASQRHRVNEVFQQNLAHNLESSGSGSMIVNPSPDFIRTSFLHQQQPLRPAAAAIGRKHDDDFGYFGVEDDSLYHQQHHPLPDPNQILIQNNNNTDTSLILPALAAKALTATATRGGENHNNHNKHRRQPTSVSSIGMHSHASASTADYGSHLSMQLSDDGHDLDEGDGRKYVFTIPKTIHGPTHDDEDDRSDPSYRIYNAGGRAIGGIQMVRMKGAPPPNTEYPNIVENDSSVISSVIDGPKESLQIRTGRNHRMSLTTDLETGRSPRLGRADSYRGQTAVIRKSTSDAVPARVRRMRRISELRKSLSSKMHSGNLFGGAPSSDANLTNRSIHSSMDKMGAGIKRNTSLGSINNSIHSNMRLNKDNIHHSDEETGDKGDGGGNNFGSAKRSGSLINNTQDHSSVAREENVLEQTYKHDHSLHLRISAENSVDHDAAILRLEEGQIGDRGGRPMLRRSESKAVLTAELHRGKRYNINRSEYVNPQSHEPSEHRRRKSTLKNTSTSNKECTTTDGNRISDMDNIARDSKIATEFGQQQIQYRLSAFTNKELHRQRYHTIRDKYLDEKSAERYQKYVSSTTTLATVNGKNNDSLNENNYANFIKANNEYKQRAAYRWKTKILDLLAEFAISIISQRKNRNNTGGWLHRYLFWTFRSRFSLVFCTILFVFYAITLLFALFIWAVGNGPGNGICVQIGDRDFGNTTVADPFIDAFALSWTTFTTVGYGLVYPGTSTTIGPDHLIKKECMGIMILTTMEAFIGILFSAIFGAIFFAKVARVSSFAQVSFSDAMIIKYATGITGKLGCAYEVHDELHGGISSDDDEGNISTTTYKKSKLPSPFLEFRIMNRLHQTRGGEIIDASINIVASVDGKYAAAQLRDAKVGNVGRGTGARGRARNRSKKASQSKEFGKPQNASRRTDHFRRSSGQKIYNPHNTQFDHRDLFKNEITIKSAKDAALKMVMEHTSKHAGNKSNKEKSNDDEPDLNAIPQRIFVKLAVESQEHPFFNVSLIL